MRRKLIALITLIIFLSSLQMYSPAVVRATGTLLHDETPGTVITFSGKQWIILEQMTDGTTYILLNGIDGKRKFSPNNNPFFHPWDYSNIAYYLNNDFYNSLSQKDLIADHSWEIKYTNGNGDQANVNAKIALISYNEFLNYAIEFFGNILPDTYDYIWWTRTPTTSVATPSVWCVGATGNLVDRPVDADFVAVRPALYLKSGLTISPDKEVGQEEDPGGEDPPEDPPDDPEDPEDPEDPSGEDPPAPGDAGSIFSAFQRIIDSVFDPAIQILTAARDKLDNIALVAARGLNLDYFLGPISMLGWQWRTLIVSVVASAFLLLTVLVVRKLYALYLTLKDGVKWW